MLASCMAQSSRADSRGMVLQHTTSAGAAGRTVARSVGQSLHSRQQQVGVTSSLRRWCWHSHGGHSAGVFRCSRQHCLLRADRGDVQIPVHLHTLLACMLAGWLAGWLANVLARLPAETNKPAVLLTHGSTASSPMRHADSWLFMQLRDHGPVTRQSGGW